MKRNKKSLSCLVLLCFIFSLVSICAESASVVAAPIGEWKFDEGTGTSAGDTSGKGKHGAITGAQWVEGFLNKALQFVGTDQFVKVAPSIAGLSNWSFSAYVKPTGTGDSYVYSEKNPETNFCIVITGDDRIRVRTYHELRDNDMWDSYQTNGGVISRDEWNHLVVTLENGERAAGSGTVMCYVNGTLVGEGRLGSSFPRTDVFGVSWTYGSSTALTRLGAAKGKTAGADFSSLYPWREMEQLTQDGQVVIKIPKFYYKRTYSSNSNKHEFLIAENPVAGFKLHPAFMRDGAEKSYVLVGTGVINAGKTRKYCRDEALSIGTGWGIIDIQTWSAIQMLYLVEYANNNSQSAIADASYRGITGLWTNPGQWIDGINIKNTERQAYIAESGFFDNKFTDNYKPTGIYLPAGSGYIVNWAYSPDADWLLLPSAVGGNGSTYIPDYFYQNWGAAADKVACGGFSTYSHNAGLFYWDVCYSSGSADSDIGARLLYIP
jgi:hypothetical protein